MNLTDDQAGRILAAVLELAVVLRDEVGEAVTKATAAVLHEAGGDPIAAIATAAALIRVDAPVDCWWQSKALPAKVNVKRLMEAPPAPKRVLAECGTHAAFDRHKQRGEPVDTACKLGEREYQAEQKRASRARRAASRRDAA